MKKRLSTILMLAVILLQACQTIVALPTVVITPNPSSTSTFAIATLTLAPPTPTKPLITTTPTTTEQLRLYHNQTVSRIMSDKYSFTVAVMDKKADFVPKSIQIIERSTNITIGQYKFFNESEIQSLCASLMQNPAWTFYETALIDYSDLPKGFVAHAYEGDYIFRITIEHLSGVQEVIELATPLDACYSQGQ